VQAILLKANEIEPISQTRCINNVLAPSTANLCNISSKHLRQFFGMRSVI